MTTEQQMLETLNNLYDLGWYWIHLWVGYCILKMVTERIFGGTE